MESFVIQALNIIKEDREDSYTTYLPIKKIDGISVSVTLYLLCDKYRKKEEKDWTYRWGIEVQSSIYDNINGEEPYSFYRSFQNAETFKFKSNDIKGLTENVIEVINSVKLLRLNKRNGMFEKKEKINPRDILCEEVYKLLKDADEEQLELSIKECSVCYTPTDTTTDCDHSVCWSCIEKLPIHEDAIGNCAQHWISCPICRSCVTEIN